MRPSTLADRAWEFWLAMDNGFVHPTVWGLLGRDNGGNRWIIDEYGASRRTVSILAESVAERLGRHGLALHDTRQILWLA